MARIITRVLRGLQAKFTGVDGPGPNEVAWADGVTPVLDVSRAGAAHSPNFDDGWIIVGRTLTGNATAAAEKEFELDLAGSLVIGSPVGGGSVAFGADQPVWVCGVSVVGLATPPSSGARVALFKNPRGNLTVAGALFLQLWTVSTTYDDVPWDPTTPTGTPFAVGVSGTGTDASRFPLPWRFVPGDILSYVSVGIDSTLTEQVQVTLWLWASPDGTPPPGF